MNRRQERSSPRYCTASAQCSAATPSAAREVGDGARHAQERVWRAPTARAARSRPRAGAARARRCGRAGAPRAPAISRVERDAASRRRARWRSRAAATRARIAAEPRRPRRPASSSHGNARHLDVQVDAIEQRARDAAPGSGCDQRRRAAALIAVGSPSQPHGHGFIAATSWKRAGKRRVPRAARDRDAALLERLAQRLEHVRRNSGSSSRNSTPWCASVTSPGRGVLPPPSERRRREIVWCGARNGRARDERPRVRAARRRCGWRSPRAPRRASSGGRIAGSRRASIVLPEPGGPTSSTLWPPAAATSRARLACACPRTSAKSSVVARRRLPACDASTGRGRRRLAAQQGRRRRAASTADSTGSTADERGLGGVGGGHEQRRSRGASAGQADRQRAARPACTWPSRPSSPTTRDGTEPRSGSDAVWRRGCRARSGGRTRRLPCGRRRARGSR